MPLRGRGSCSGDGDWREHRGRISLLSSSDRFSHPCHAGSCEANDLVEGSAGLAHPLKGTCPPLVRKTQVRGVWHQAPGIQSESSLSLVLPQPFHKSPVIHPVMEDPLPVSSAQHHVADARPHFVCAVRGAWRLPSLLLLMPA